MQLQFDPNYQPFVPAWYTMHPWCPLPEHNFFRNADEYNEFIAKWFDANYLKSENHISNLPQLFRSGAAHLRFKSYLAAVNEYLDSIPRNEFRFLLFKQILDTYGVFQAMEMLDIRKLFRSLGPNAFN